MMLKNHKNCVFASFFYPRFWLFQTTISVLRDSKNLVFFCSWSNFLSKANFLNLVKKSFFDQKNKILDKKKSDTYLVILHIYNVIIELW